MATPKLDFVTLADNVLVAATTSVNTTDNFVMSPGRTSVTLRVVGLTVAGAAVAGGTFILQSFLQGPNPTGASPLVRAGWYEIATFVVPPDGSMLEADVQINSLGSGLDVNAGTALRGVMRAGAANVYFTVVAIAGGP